MSDPKDVAGGAADLAGRMNELALGGAAPCW